jgi:16S rRNA (guanine(1405)-N(7))-methyltransferase
MPASEPSIETLVAEILASPKYRAVSPELVRDLARRELAAGRSRKEAVKAVKNKLHQVAGAYFEARPEYASWLRELAAAAGPKTTDQGSSTDNQAPEPGTEVEEAQGSSRFSVLGSPSPVLGLPPFRAICRDIMRRHASTRERLPILERFYAETLATIAPPRTVLDLACGLGPLAIPWMPLAPGATYHACDLYADLAGFLNEFFVLAGITGNATVCDLVQGAPAIPADLALALKLLPVLEQVDRAAPLRLIQQIQAPHILVSFPAQSLGGRGKGMAATYERRFHDLIAGQGWGVQQFTFATELVFLVTKPGTGHEDTRTRSHEGRQAG